jgi:hypothetical protein
MNAQGNNWIFVGKRNTGKTFSALQLSLFFRVGDYARNIKKIIVLDHANNSSYSEIGNILTIEQLQYRQPLDLVCKVQTDDIEAFCDILIKKIRNSVVIFDDAGTIFGGHLTDLQRLLLKTPKNNGNEYFFQFHQFGGVEIPPDMLRATNMFVVKETIDDFNDLPQKVQPNMEIRYLLYKAKMDNEKLPINQSWATYIYDSEADKVLINNEWINGNDFFPKRKQNEFKI